MVGTDLAWLTMASRRLQRIVRSRLYQLYTAPTQKECEASRDELAEWLREHAQLAAAETLLRDWDDFVTFYGSGVLVE